MSYPDPNEAVPMSSARKGFWICFFAIVGIMVVYGFTTAPPGMTKAMRAERCASYQGALPEVGSMHYRLLDGLKVQVLSTRYVFEPNRYDAMHNLDERFCAHSIMVRVEGHSKKSGMRMIEFNTEAE